MNFLKRIAKFVAGVFLCQYPLTSLVVVGWTQRRMERTTHRRLEAQGMGAPVADPQTGSRRAWVQWLRGIKQLWIRGAGAAANLFAATLPATALWYFAWVLGWNISFHKQYEQSHLGVMLGWLGIVWFAIAMLYIPTALARQAAENDWRAFWRFRENARLARRAPVRQLLLAIGFGFAGLGVMIAKVAPYFAGSSPEFANYTTEELTTWLNQYYLVVTALLLPVYVMLWQAAASIYARAHAKQQQRLEQTTPDAASTTAALPAAPAASPATKLATSAVTAEGNFFTRLLARGVTGIALFVTMLAWIGFSWQVFIAQFFHYIPGMGWLNHPLIILPWLRMLPPGW